MATVQEISRNVPPTDFAERMAQDPCVQEVLLEADKVINGLAYQGWDKQTAQNALREAYRLAGWNAAFMRFYEHVSPNSFLGEKIYQFSAKDILTDHLYDRLRSFPLYFEKVQEWYTEVDETGKNQFHRAFEEGIAAQKVYMPTEAPVVLNCYTFI